MTSKIIDIGIIMVRCNDYKEKEQQNKEVKMLWECFVNKDLYAATDRILHD